MDEHSVHDESMLSKDLKEVRDEPCGVIGEVYCDRRNSV